MLENWRHHIYPDDFEKLSNFVEKTKNGIKEKKICVLFLQKHTNKSIFLEELREYVGLMHVYSKQIGFLKRPSTGTVPKLIIVDNPEHYEFDDTIPHIKEYLNEPVIYRRPYTIQTKANIIIITDDLNFFDDFTPTTKEFFNIVRFGHL